MIFHPKALPMTLDPKVLPKTLHPKALSKIFHLKALDPEILSKTFHPKILSSLQEFFEKVLSHLQLPLVDESQEASQNLTTDPTKKKIWGGMVTEQLAEEGAAQGQHQLVCGEGLKVLGDDGEVGKLGLEVQTLPGLT